MDAPDQQVPVALDAMGGDNAPSVTVAGAVTAVRRFGIPVTLVGEQSVLDGELHQHSSSPITGITIVPAAQTIGMEEHAAAVVRSRVDSSMHVACRLVRAGAAEAAVSAGNSGAFFAIAMLTLGRLPGVDRPALATIFPTTTEPVLVLDVGANAEVKVQHLVQFAAMGAAYAERVLHRQRPSVALLSNGEEEQKGPLVVQEAHQLLKQSSMRFVGNVEGKDVPHGNVDVVVCDGYAGNVLIKTAEGTAEALMRLLRAELTRDLRSKVLAAGLRPNFRRIRDKMDYAEYGGAPLLGVQGVCIIAHGRSNAWAIANAVRVAHEAVQNHVVEALREGIVQSATLS